MLLNNYRIFQFYNTESVWNVGRENLASEISFGKFFLDFETKTQILTTNTIFYVNQFVKSAEIYNRYPDSIWSALSKIGGFIAFGKLSIFITTYHEFLFKKQLRRKVRENDTKCSDNVEVEIVNRSITE